MTEVAVRGEGWDQREASRRGKKRSGFGLPSSPREDEHDSKR